MKRGLPLLKLFQCCKKFRVLLLLCPWFPRLISIAASFGLSSIIHGKSSFERTIVYSQRDDLAIPAILFEPMSYMTKLMYSDMTTDQTTRWRIMSPQKNYSSCYQSDLIWSAIMVSFVREIFDLIIFFPTLKGPIAYNREIMIILLSPLVSFAL